MLSVDRFSKHPDIALPNLEPHAYGLIFLKTAKNMLGNVLAVPSRETVIALTLLAGISHGIGTPFEFLCRSTSVKNQLKSRFGIRRVDGRGNGGKDGDRSRSTSGKSFLLDSLPSRPHISDSHRLLRRAQSCPRKIAG